MMAGLHVRVDHLKLIAASHVRNSLRSGSGVIFLIVSMIVGLILAGIAVFPVEILMRESEKHSGSGDAFNAAVNHFGPQVLDTVMSANAEQSRYLLQDHPALISLFAILLMLFLPFITALSSFNQTSGDIGTRGLRYLLLRTERANIFLGRLIGTYLFSLAVLTIIIIVVGLYVIIKVKFYPAGDVLGWMVRVWFVCAIYSMPWVAMCAWVSATIPIPIVSLVVSAIGLLAWLGLVWGFSGKVSALSNAAYATPWGYKWWLLDGSAGSFVLGVLVMLAFTALFTFLGLRTFHKRDV